VVQDIEMCFAPHLRTRPDVTVLNLDVTVYMRVKDRDIAHVDSKNLIKLCDI